MIVFIGVIEQWLIWGCILLVTFVGGDSQQLEPSKYAMRLLRLARLLRMLRLLRLIRDIPPLHTLAVGILESVQAEQGLEK